MSGPKTDRGTYVPPALGALPDVGQVFIDPVYGTRQMRLTNLNFFYTYSYFPAMSRNSRWILARQINSSAARLIDFDAANFAIRSYTDIALLRYGTNGDPFDRNSCHWFKTADDLCYLIGNVTSRLYTFNAATQTSTLIKDFAALYPGTYLYLPSVSDDDDVIAFSLNSSTTFQTVAVMVYRVSTDTVLFYSARGNVDEVQIDKTGKYLLIKVLSHAGGQNPQWSSVVTVADGTEVLCTQDTNVGHSDQGDAEAINANGNSSTFHFVQRTRYGNPVTQSAFLDAPAPTYTSGYHISNRMMSQQWVLLSTFNTDGSAVAAQLENEMLLIQRNDPSRIWRFCHHNSSYSTYYDAPKASLSMDGRFSVYGSNWGNPGTANNAVFISETLISQANSDPPGDPMANTNIIPTSIPVPVPMSNALPRHYSAVRQGSVYTACLQAIGALSVNSTTATGLIITNPATSGVNFVLLELLVALASAPAGIAALALVGDVTGTVTHTTPMTTGFQSALFGAASAPVSQALVDTAATLPSKTTVRVVPGGPVAASSISAPFIKDNIDGALIMTPGSFLSLQSFTTAISVLASLTWMEVPA